MSDSSYLKKYEILNQVDVCILLDISRTTLWRYVNCRGLPHHKKRGSEPFYFKSEILDWLKGQKKSSLVERRYELTIDGFIHR